MTVIQHYRCLCRFVNCSSWAKIYELFFNLWNIYRRTKYYFQSSSGKLIGRVSRGFYFFSENELIQGCAILNYKSLTKYKGQLWNKITGKKYKLWAENLKEKENFIDYFPKYLRSWFSLPLCPLHEYYNENGTSTTCIAVYDCHCQDRNWEASPECPRKMQKCEPTTELTFPTNSRCSVSIHLLFFCRAQPKGNGEVDGIQTFRLIQK